MSRSHSPSSDPIPPANVSSAPPPWRLRTKLYVFATPLKPVNREDPILQGLPPGSYNPSETLHPSALAPVNGSPQWEGGLMTAVLVRYEDSPVGPYDELIMVVNGFANPHAKGTTGRITNIYVSTRQSVWNGRINWNIQKHLARFEFTPTGPMSSIFKAFLPDGEIPFFAARVTDSHIPGIPIPSLFMNPFMRIVQPPLLAGLPADIQVESHDESWLSITPLYRGKWRLAYIQPVEGGPESFGDGLQFPKFKPFWIGVKFTGEILFPDGKKVTRKAE
ncbi:hypothetical protein B0F90DRAFT_1629790 [Multifurca ochricompacta]|uniref:Acetoacetate decarboxylase n=1 Tax=Multifurca ochricompacta TaxID=376703 RepID=A0AAD4QN99_9AGAM|nr:hypothetical protein B0F90DRAFT_1629790 [Multifurca ochricompacta]